MKNEVLLTIITPYYKALDYLKELRNVLEPQLRDTEWIIVDDGCCERELDDFPAIVVHLPRNSGGASIPRNVGLDLAKGRYVAFIDSDDLVEPDYIESILKKCEEGWDYFFIGWRSETFTILEPPEWNCSIWNCVYSRNLIGDERFNPNLRIGEDYDFNLRVRKGESSLLERVLYYYRDTPNSLMKRGEHD